MEINSKHPSVNLASGLSKLFYDKEYIHPNKFGACLYYSKEVIDQNSYYECALELGAKTIITKENVLSNNRNFECTTFTFFRAARNIFNTKKYKVDFCDLKIIK